MLIRPSVNLEGQSSQGWGRGAHVCSYIGTRKAVGGPAPSHARISAMSESSPCCQGADRGVSQGPGRHFQATEPFPNYSRKGTYQGKRPSVWWVFFHTLASFVRKHKLSLCLSLQSGTGRRLSREELHMVLPGLLSLLPEGEEEAGIPLPGVDLEGTPCLQWLPLCWTGHYNSDCGHCGTKHCRSWSSGRRNGPRPTAPGHPVVIRRKGRLPEPRHRAGCPSPGTPAFRVPPGA